uniref:Uncharacterized protein n=1 Tax=Cacopsylla melanoneura TaxID=428564 RepID=A0A8D9BSN4_9HEMI
MKRRLKRGGRGRGEERERDRDGGRKRNGEGGGGRERGIENRGDGERERDEEKERGIWRNVEFRITRRESVEKSGNVYKRIILEIKMTPLFTLCAPLHPPVPMLPLLLNPAYNAHSMVHFPSARFFFSFFYSSEIFPRTLNFTYFTLVVTYLLATETLSITFY